MSPNEILTDLRRQPFEAFRLVMADGPTFEIRHPDQCLVLTSAVIIGLTTQQNQEVSDRYVKVDCRHISRIEYLPPTKPAGTNGAV